MHVVTEMIEIQNNADSNNPSRAGDRAPGVFHDQVDYRYAIREVSNQTSEVHATQSDRNRFRDREGCDPSVWIAEAENEIVGSISMVCVDKQVGRLEHFRVAPEWQADRRLARRLVRAAAESARERGLLKLNIEVPEDLPGLPPGGYLPVDRAAEARSRVKVYFQMLGFAFSRELNHDGRTMLEFYLNLYESPGI